MAVVSEEFTTFAENLKLKEKSMNHYETVFCERGELGAEDARLPH